MTKRRANLCHASLLLLASCAFDVPVGTSGSPQPTDTSPPSDLTERPTASLAALAGLGPSPAPRAATKPKPEPQADPDIVAQADDDWPQLGNTPARTAASDKTSLSATALLMPRWKRALPNVTGTPVIWGGVAYFGDWDGAFHAAHIEDGRELWTTDVGTLGRGVVSSAQVTEQTLFAADRHGTVYALERSSGKLLWKNALAEHAATRIWSSPSVLNKTLVIGLSSFAQSAGTPPPQTIVGIDTETGATLWSNDAADVSALQGTLGGSPELAMWSTATFDPARGLALLCHGRSDAALVGWDVLVAIDYRTGVIKYVVPLEAPGEPTPGGTAPFDNDGSFHPDSAPLLFSTDPAGGPSHDVVGVASRSGVFRAHSRDTGAPVWLAPIPEQDGVKIALDEVRGLMVPAAFANGTVYSAYSAFPNSTHFMAIEGSSGKVLWTRHVHAGFALGALALAKDAVLATIADFELPEDRGGSLLFLNAHDGSIAQSYAAFAPGRFAGGIALSGNIVALGSAGSFQASGSSQGAIVTLAY